MEKVDLVERGAGGDTYLVAQIRLDTDDVQVLAVERRYASLLEQPMTHPDSGVEVSLTSDPVTFMANLRRVVAGRWLCATRLYEGESDYVTDGRRMVTYLRYAVPPSSSCRQVVQSLAASARVSQPSVVSRSMPAILPS